MPTFRRILMHALGVLFVLGFARVAFADLVLSAPPRESLDAGRKLYEPLAEHLSRQIGLKVVYRPADSWGAYQAMMTRGDYDLVFDGPHFVSWRMERQQHAPLAALPGTLSFVVVALQEGRIKTLGDVAGKRLCGHAPPNLAALVALEQFTNPVRQPVMAETRGFEAAYNDVLTGSCAAAVLPREAYRSLDEEAGKLKVVFESKPYPNQALSAGPRVSAAMQQQIIRALFSPQGRDVTRAVAVAFGAAEFVAAAPEQYQGHAALLANVWGFEPKR